MSLFMKMTVCLVVMAVPVVAHAQTFASITIKTSRSTDPRDERIQLLPGGRWVASGVSVIRLLSSAYDLPVNPSPRLSTTPLFPRWAILERFDIEAKVTANVISSDLPDREVKIRIQRMLRALLADRFGLVMKVEQKKMSAYVLNVAPGGPKLQKSVVAEKDCASNIGPDGCHYFVEGLGVGHPLNAKAIDMDDLVHYIENWTDLPVVNRTSLTGLFAVNTEGWVPMKLPPPPPNATPGRDPFANLPTIFTVLSKLGLELKRQEETVPVYTVQRIERPATN
jgi:uncharacterized protein (TIGR03435 family)